MHGHRMEDDRDGTLAADRADLRRGRVDRLEDFEHVPIGAPVLVGGHELKRLAAKPVTSRFPHNLSVDETAHTTAPARSLAIPVPRELGEVGWRIGIGACTAASAAFVLVQMRAWPPHEDE